VRPRLWRCPACGHEFVTENLWHSCGNYDLEHHFAGKGPQVRKIYDRFVKLVRACGKVTIYPQKTRIVCMVRMRFAGAITQKSALQCGLILRRKVAHPHLVRIETYGPRSFGHKFKFTEPAQLDREFAELLREAYRIGCQEE
jgi:hypothetical protein